MKRRRTIPERRRYLWVAAYVLPLVIGAILVVLLSRDWQPEWRFMAFGLVLVPTVYRLHTIWVERRRLRELTTCDWRRCLYCFFDLRGLPEHGTCPECGERYIIREVREEWKDAVAAEADEHCDDED